MATYKELKAQAEALLRQAEELRQVEVAAVIEDIRGKMADYGITLADLENGAHAAPSSAPVAAKYRDPASGKTWSGRGRVPGWMAAELAKGRKKEEFLI